MVLPAGGERVHQFLADPGDLPAVPVRPRHPRHPELPGQRGLHHRRGDRGGGALEPVQRPGVQLAPPAVPLRLHLVQHQVVHVKLRVPVAGGVLPERPDHPVPRVLPLAQLGAGFGAGTAVIPGAGHPRLILQVLQRRPVALHDRGPHPPRAPLQVIRLGGVPAPPGLLRGGEQPAVEQGDGLGHRHGDVPERHRVPGLRLGQGPQLGQPRRAGVRLGRRQLLEDGLLGGELLGGPAQPGLPGRVAGVQVLAVQRLEHAPVDHLPRGEPSTARPRPAHRPAGSPPLSAGRQVVLQPAGGRGPGCRCRSPATGRTRRTRG